jgi:hypothetical protein
MPRSHLQPASVAILWQCMSGGVVLPQSCKPECLGPHQCLPVIVNALVYQPDWCSLHTTDERAMAV